MSCQPLNLTARFPSLHITGYVTHLQASIYSLRGKIWAPWTNTLQTWQVFWTQQFGQNMATKMSNSDVHPPHVSHPQRTAELFPGDNGASLQWPSAKVQRPVWKAFTAWKWRKHDKYTWAKQSVNVELQTRGQWPSRLPSTNAMKISSSNSCRLKSLGDPIQPEIWDQQPRLP